MPFDRPSLKDLINRSVADIESRLDGADASLRRMLLNILAKMQAGSVHGLYGYLDWIALQGMPDTAETEQLERWASIWGKNRKSASKASGTAIFTGTSGSVIPANTYLKRNDGFEYETMAEAVITDGSAIVSIEAVQAGVESNTSVGAVLRLPSPVAGIQSTAIASELAGGTDVESDDDLRGRLLARIRQAPHGGATFDYVQWALDVPGVTRAWAYPRELGDGTVTVRIMTDGLTIDGIPAAESVAAVQSYIDNVRPVTAEVIAVAPVAVPMNPQINLTPNTAPVRAAVTAELSDLLRREAIPGATILVSHLREAISIAMGETDHALQTPANNITHSTGQIAVLGTITWGDL
ncbi:baseplate J protein [Pseudodesulfovibrio sp. JC047]|uniref:baseplate J/gp47 family protein n=1 Tax=Pseudodesulfovibrio sp. JC047 TaxID=2683199 RepID=UPI0013D68FEA|nr:baseplate J/gp47 family protein [Pseudodesulfovibrio sp. JC047]NDV20888.1 baseplate J protein [Pseudodesulfovibrio sp. JC047]